MSPIEKWFWKICFGHTFAIYTIFLLDVLPNNQTDISRVSHMEEDFAFCYRVCSLELLSAFEHIPYWLQPSVMLQEALT